MKNETDKKLTMDERKTKRLRFILACGLVFASSLMVSVRSNDNVKSGYSIEVRIFFLVRSNKWSRNVIEKTLNWFRIHHCYLKRDKKIVVSSFRDVHVLVSEVNQIDKDGLGLIFNTVFRKRWNAFKSILSMIATREHLTSEGVIKTLDTRMVFMPNALNRTEFLKKYPIPIRKPEPKTEPETTGDDQE